MEFISIIHNFNIDHMSAYSNIAAFVGRDSRTVTVSVYMC